MEQPIKNLNFIDLKRQQQEIKQELEQAVLRVMSHGNYILGPEVAELESNMAEYLGIKHVVTCANGTDALVLVLRAQNIGYQDVVFVPSFTFAASAEAVRLVGATPCFVDVDPKTYNIDTNSLLQAIDFIKKEHPELKPKMVMPVDLFGRPCDYDLVNQIAQEHNLFVLSDSAQGFGAEYKAKKSACFADATTTSFFPAKPLGCYGDGGAIFTNDSELCHLLKSLRVHGKGADKYDNVRIGTNSRLDTMQAAVLLEKLKIFPKELEHRQTVAMLYNKYLNGLVQTPVIDSQYKSAWAQYTIVLPENIAREELMAHLQEQGVPSVVYYIKPLHLQTAYNDMPCVNNQLPVTEHLANRVLSLPMDGYLQPEMVEAICYKIKSFFECAV